MGPADPILGLTEQFQKDAATTKVSLGVGAYRDDHGKPYVLPSVREAEERLMTAQANKEYAGIAGVKEFVKLSLDFAYGKESSALAEQRIAGVQTISGTGACRLAGEFFARFLGEQYPIYLPNPTWGNHIPIMKNARLDVRKYAYYAPETRGLDFEGMIRDIRDAPQQSVFLLHACAHNPTGVDPTPEQWQEISHEMKQKEHISFFDCAYQGFASGDADKDAQAIRQFVEDGHNIFLSQSYAKNFGLYGERIGALSVVGQDADEAARIESQLKLLIRPMYSNPPIHGARIVSTVLSDPDLSAQWYGECKAMADRIISMRTLLRTHLESMAPHQTWHHITDQIGMFCYTGLSAPQVDQLIHQHHIYLTQDGRISMAGVTSENVEYIATSMAAVV